MRFDPEIKMTANPPLADTLKRPIVGQEERMGPGGRGISRHLTEEGALPICEQCNSSGNSKPINIHSSEDGSISFTISRMWAHKPFEEADCRYVYLCFECCWQVQLEAVAGEEAWFASGVYGIHPDCQQCQERT